MKKECVPYGSDVSSGSFECADCGNIISVQSVTSLPPCSEMNKGFRHLIEHTKKCWIVLSGQGDSHKDPYPSK